ncbi:MULTISPECIES: DUF305 domain-containing protein [Asticcacaulis]|uniref:DUF305 domain-containing protein n=1 Tax=Asticcacaulis TaxID=76890 RepID=UPI001AEA6F31|nr:MULTISPECIES: DUF305 domain-containing protein [Asticcacaulis]MBP2160496.1 uncharacterized protein (DUF305 family) [Asticcacaulis solisilvae]MDR6801541.1 uncharacterized protein (DUF305 family) [Asticcacaulis sp. BE141]
MQRFLFSAAIAITLACSFPAVAHEPGKMEAVKTSPHAEHAPYDVQFLDSMAQHHKEGIHMFQMSLPKISSPELKAILEKAIQEQKTETPKLQALRDSVDKKAPKAINRSLPGMEPMDMTMMASWKGTGHDVHVIDMTIKHHQGAIDLSRDALSKAQNASVKSQAQMIIDKQTKEIAELQQLRSSLT